MSRLAFIIFVGFFSMSVAAVGDDQWPGFDLYLGLSMPYPESIPEWNVKLNPGQFIRDGLYPLQLQVDQKGKVREIIYSPDSAVYFEPVEKKKIDIRFRFLEGQPLDFPMTIPVMIEYSYVSDKYKKATIHFPVSPEMYSDTTLLNLFFESNNISPPKLTNMPPVFYRFNQEKTEPLCLTITALVSLDENGELVELSYPFEGQDKMTHQIQSSLIRAEFEPPVINGQSRSCDYLLTFRVFDNLRYPFSPFVPHDTTRDKLFTEDYFLIEYFNPNDISICALPRRYGSGRIPMQKELRSRRGETKLRIGITRSGQASAISMAISQGRRELNRVISKLTSWYPALNNRGVKETYTGNVTLIFDGGSHIVYIPEWLEK